MSLAGALANLVDGHHILQRLALASVELLALFLIVLLIIGVLRIRSSRVALLLWLVVLIKPLVALSVGSLLLIPVFALPESASPVSNWGAEAAFEPAYDEGTVASGDGMEYWESEEVTLTGAEMTTTSLDAPGRVQAIAWTEVVPRVCLAVWLVGMAVFMLRYLVARRRLAWILRTSRRAPSELDKLYTGLADRMGACRPPRLRVTDEVESPAIAGLMRPTILTPAWLIAEADDDQIAWTLRHELTHWRWCDLWVVAVRDLVCMLFWFHPIAWWTGRRLIESMEQACDRAMLADASEAGTYAEQLFLVLRKMKERRRAVIAGGLFATRTQVGKRIAALLDGTSTLGPQLTAPSLVGIVILASAALSVGVGFAASSPGTSPTETARDTRVLHFPSRQVVGWLTVVNPDEVAPSDPFYYDAWGHGTNPWHTVIGDVLGDVRVAADGHCLLNIQPRGWRDPRWIKGLRPDDLYAVSFPYHWPGNPRPNDRVLPSIARLTGLKVLSLQYGDFTARGLKYLGPLQSLERMTLPEGLTGEGLAQVVRLRSLKALAFIDPQITDEDLALLARLPALEDLHLGGKQLTDAGLAQLAGLPRLRYLQLWPVFNSLV